MRYVCLYVFQAPVSSFQIFYKNEELRDLKLTYNPMTLQNLTTYPPPSPVSSATLGASLWRVVVCCCGRC